MQIIHKNRAAAYRAKNFLFQLLSCLFLSCVASPTLHAQSSAIRVICDGQNAGAEVSINGTFKGECPIDIHVSPGTVHLTATKTSDPLRAGSFERTLRIGAGVAQRVEVQLVMELTPLGIQKEEEAARANQAAFEKAMEARSEKVEKCTEERFMQAFQQGQHCYTYSGGCVGPLFCESVADRNQRCFGNPQGFPDRAPIAQACERQIPKPPSPPQLSEVVKRRE